MENPKVGLIIVFLVAAAALAGGLIGTQMRDQGARSGSPAGAAQADPSPGRSIQRATYDPIHFKPAIVISYLFIGNGYFQFAVGRLFNFNFFTFTYLGRKAAAYTAQQGNEAKQTYKPHGSKSVANKLVVSTHFHKAADKPHQYANDGYAYKQYQRTKGIQVL